MKGNILLLIISLATLNASAQNDSSEATAHQIEFVKLPPGSFIYGRFNPPFPIPDSVSGNYNGLRMEDYRLAKKLAEKDRRPGFEVSIATAFELSKYEITQAQWKKVMGDNPSVFKGDRLPVDNISWHDAMLFANKLSAADSVYNYRLPSEFEWEYAARAGLTDDISWNDIREQAHLGSMSTMQVGSRKPNAWGLYDMLGNLWEWTADVYNEKIFADPYPAKSGKEHVLKGASFTGDVKNATYMTHAAGPANRWDVGVRLLREYKRTKPAADTGAHNSGTPQPMKHKSNVPGWHISRTTHQGTTPAVWRSGNTITLMQRPYGQGGVLLTNKKYTDFELSVEVKIDSFCNGGIFLRSTESGQAYQVELSEPGGTGNLLGEMLKVSKPAVAEKKSKVWKPNSWNHFRIRMVGAVPRITLWINGELMWDVTQPKNDFIAAATEGMIGLQVHWSATYSAAAEAFDMSSSWRPGGKHLFRNISIKELPISSQQR